MDVPGEVPIRDLKAAPTPAVGSWSKETGCSSDSRPDAMAMIGHLRCAFLTSRLQQRVDNVFRDLILSLRFERSHHK